MKKKIILDDINHTIFISKRISLLINKYIYLYLFGSLGTGKTFFCKSFIKNLGYRGIVSSPSFSLINKYKIKNNFIYHFDLYRINNFRDLIDIEIYNYFDKKNICLVEWPDKVLNLLPKADLHFNFFFLNDNKRLLYISSNTNRGFNILKSLF